MPDAAASTLFCLYDVMNAFALLDGTTAALGAPVPFRAEIVGMQAGRLELANGVQLDVQRSADTIDATDIVIVPSIVLGPQGWQANRYPELVAWLKVMHARGALLCSACSGIFLLAETGLFDGKDATVHFGYARAFTAVHPGVTIHPPDADRLRAAAACGGREAEAGAHRRLGR